MADDIARKRLKKKVLDRWENEGGKINADPTGADESGQTSDTESEGNQLSASHDNSVVGAPTSHTKNRKPAQK
ncbi:MAG TPA: hypothetical protein VF544_11655 [Pyrinomonadaceae bacterium]|jgi:hypothetical protein